MRQLYVLLSSEEGQDIAEYAVMVGCNSDYRSRDASANRLQFEYSFLIGCERNRLAEEESTREQDRLPYMVQLLSKSIDIIQQV